MYETDTRESRRAQMLERHARAIRVYCDTLEAVRQEALVGIGPEMLGAAPRSVDVRVYDALQAQGLDHRDLLHPDADGTATLSESEERGTEG